MKTKKTTKVRVTRTGRRLIVVLVVALGSMLSLISCNVTRTITTQSEYFTKGDTTCTIVTKTTEVYDASKKSNL